MQTEELFSSVCCCSIFVANFPETKSGSFVSGGMTVVYFFYCISLELK